MPVEGAPAGYAIHASAVAIGGRALLILGRSGAGKSRLAAALVAASTPRRRIVLVGDDRILLVRSARGLQARPHPRVAGFIERRGMGFLAVAWCDRAVVAGMALLGENVVSEALAGTSPSIRLADSHVTERVEAVLAWWPYSSTEKTRPAEDVRAFRS